MTAFWNLASFPQERIGEEVQIERKGKIRTRFQSDEKAMRAATTILFPANWVVDHGPTTVHTSPHWSNLENWRVSHFAIEMAAPFVGAWYPKENISRLRIDEQGQERIAAKLYSDYWCTMVEHWGGIGDVFEHPGRLQPGHDPVEFTQGYWIAQNLSGPVSWADNNIALYIKGEIIEVQSRSYQADIIDASGKTIATGAIGPHSKLSASGDSSRVIIRLDGEIVLDQVFPLQPIPAKDTTVPDHIQDTFQFLTAPPSTAP